MRRILCLGETIGETGGATQQDVFSFNKSKPHVLSTAVRASWSMTILLCTRKGSPSRMFEQSPGATMAQTGLKLQALFKDESESDRNALHLWVHC